MLSVDMLTSPQKTPVESLTGRQIWVGQGNLQPPLKQADLWHWWVAVFKFSVFCWLWFFPERFLYISVSCLSKWNPQVPEYHCCSNCASAFLLFFTCMFLIYVLCHSLYFKLLINLMKGLLHSLSTWKDILLHPWQVKHVFQTAAKQMSHTLPADTSSILHSCMYFTGPFFVISWRGVLSRCSHGVCNYLF